MSEAFAPNDTLRGVSHEHGAPGEPVCLSTAQLLQHTRLEQMCQAS